MVGRALDMAFPVEFLFPSCPAVVAPSPKHMGRADGSKPASALAAVHLDGGHPGFLHTRKRLAHGILQLRGMARDFPAAGSWHSACRGNTPPVAKANSTNPCRGFRGAGGGRRVHFLDHHTHSPGERYFQPFGNEKRGEKFEQHDPRTRSHAAIVRRPSSSGHHFFAFDTPCICLGMDSSRTRNPVVSKYCSGPGYGWIRPGSPHGVRYSESHTFLPHACAGTQ